MSRLFLYRNLSELVAPPGPDSSLGASRPRFQDLELLILSRLLIKKNISELMIPSLGASRPRFQDLELLIMNRLLL